jgi:hypothetical protein
MGQDYQKTSKLYTLNTTGITVITGASVIHAMYNGSNSTASIVIDNTHIMHLPTDDHITFPNAVPFSTVRMYSTNTTGVILYS